MVKAIRPEDHYKQIVVRGEPRDSYLAETNDGSSPDYDFGVDSSSCVRNFYTPWTSDGERIPLLRLDILGDVSIGFAKSQKYLARTIPMEHDDFPDELFASSLRITGNKGAPIYGDTQDVQAFDEAVAHVGYSQNSYVIMTDAELTAASGAGFPDEGSLLRYVTVDQQTAAKYQTVPALGALVWTNRFEWPEDGGPDPGQSLVFKDSMILFEGDLMLTWHEVPLTAFPISAIQVLTGRTNRNPFGHPNSVLGQFPAETLVAGPPKRKLRRMRNGQLGYDITYPFKYYPQGANYNFFMAPGQTPGFYPFATDINGTKLLFPLDGIGDPIKNPLQFTFEDLFRPEQ